MRTLVALMLLLQAPASEFRFDTADTITVQAQEDYSRPTVVFVYPLPGREYDTRCVLVYPRDKKSQLGWLIDRVEKKVELVYIGYPWPQFCKEEIKEKEK